MIALLLVLQLLTSPVAEPDTDWEAAFEYPDGLLLLEVLKPPSPPPAPVPAPAPVVTHHPLPPGQVDSLIQQYFPPEAWDWARRVSWCESRWTPTAQHPTSGAAGLFQHLPKYWADRSSRAGWAGADIFDPVANVAVAAWLYQTGGPSHWVCK